MRRLRIPAGEDMRNFRLGSFEALNKVDDWWGVSTSKALWNTSSKYAASYWLHDTGMLGCLADLRTRVEEARRPACRFGHLERRPRLEGEET